MFSRAITRSTRIGSPRSAKQRLDRAAEAVLKADRRLPAEHGAGGGDVGERVADVAGARRLEALLGRLPEQVADRVDELVDAVRRAGSDVEDPAVRVGGVGGVEVGR